MYIPDWWVWLIVNPVSTALTIVCFMTHTAVLVIQMVRLHLMQEIGKKFKSREDRCDKVVHYLESVGK